jgi:LmbE family N-acetylglucosaminyl deacetylase
MKSLVTFVPWVVLAAASLRAQHAEPEAGLVALHQALLDAATDAVVLNVAAHPDDESSRTNAVLRRKYGMRVVTVYTTYGDGGQNAIGREIGPELAALRVRETLRAAAMSGVEVRWLGMDDFGFSKTLEETRAKWGDDKLLAAMRKVVDEIDPDFVLTNHTIAQGHGHHRASFWAIDTVLKERAAAKGYVPPLLTRSKIEEATWVVDPTELEPARGETYARLAHRAWVQHVTQGPWGPHNPMQVGRDFWKVVNTEHIAPPLSNGEASPMPWCWVRPSELPPAYRLAREARELPREQLRAALVEFEKQPRSREPLAASRLRGDFERARLALDNIRVEAWLERDEVASGSEGKVNVVVHGAERLLDLRVYCGDRIGTAVTAPVRTAMFDGLPVSPAMALPQATSASTGPVPTVPGPAGRFAVTFPCEQPSSGPEPRFAEVRARFTFGDLDYDVTTRLAYTPVPAVAMAWDREVQLVPKGKVVERLLSVTVKSNGERDVAGPVRVSMGPGIQATSIPGRLQLTREHDEARILVRAKITADELTPDASIEVGLGEHAVRLPVRVADVTIPDGMHIALVRGPDDTTEATLADLGVPFVALDRDALATARLDAFTAVLLDIRAYHHQPALAEVRDRLLAYCRGGGRIVAMYHKPDEWNERAGHPLLAPFPLVVGSDRVTEEDCAVTFLKPEHALLTKPHALGAADFAGWVQERGLNFPKTWDAAWTPLLSMKDTGDEKPLEGSLLHTQYGRGDFVYCSLVLYRQLRVGHVGAARLLVNLLAR